MWLSQAVGEPALVNNYGSFIPYAWVTALEKFDRNQIIDGYYSWLNSKKKGEPVYVPKLPEIVAYCKGAGSEPAMYKKIPKKEASPEPTDESRALARKTIDKIQAGL